MPTALDQLSFLGKDLLGKIQEISSIKSIPKNTEILREEQYVKVIPIVLDGLVRVFSRFDDRELLLYYIKPVESCIMSFTAFLHNQPSKIFASTLEDSTILLVPVDQLHPLLAKYPKLNRLFYEQFDLRYSELLDTIQNILFNNMDQRLFEYLSVKTKLMDTDTLKISHSGIARDLGTVREVISRIIKKLEVEGKISQTNHGIKIHR